MIVGFLTNLFCESSLFLSELPRMADLMLMFDAVPEDVLSTPVLHCSHVLLA